MAGIIVSIIIPTYNDWNRLEGCLRALASQDFPSDHFEIIIANNNPDDKKPETLVLADNCYYIEVKSPGSYAARNAAIKLAKGEIFGFTDSDCVPHRSWISNALKLFKEYPHITRIGGNVELFFVNGNPNKIELYDHFYAFNQKWYVDKNETAVTANMFSYACVFQQTGLFDQTLKSGGDFLWGSKAGENGFKIAYGSDVIVYHPARNEIQELVTKEKRVGTGQAGFMAKESKWQSYVSFLKTIRPKFYDIDFLIKNRGSLPPHKIFWVWMLRQYLIAVRAHAKLIKQLS